jgi:predicted nucleic acid-binding protein
VPKERIYIDACVWISFYKPDGNADALTYEQKVFLQSLLKDVDESKTFIVGSSLLLTQVLDTSIDILMLAFDGRKGLLMPADDEVCKAARLLQKQCLKKTTHALGSEDAIHLATASLYQCSKYVTKDRKRKGNQLAPIQDREILGEMLGLKIVDPAELTGQALLIEPE